MSHRRRHAKLRTVTLRVVFRIAREREDELTAQLWRADTLGSETAADGHDHLRVVAFFDREPVGLEDFQIVERGEAPSEDWLKRWRDSAQPLEVGERFLLDPREIDQPAPDAGGRILLRVPARAAFGTGSHESTRLVLELMEGVGFTGRAVLDVGTGTGVLALAAMALGARRAVAFDVDLISPILAAQNADLNSLEVNFFAGRIEALTAPPRFDVALVNVIPEEIRAALPSLRALLAPDGKAIFSGILRERGRAALAVLRHAGFRRLQSRRAGDWVAYLCEAA